MYSSYQQYQQPQAQTSNTHFWNGSAWVIKPLNSQYNAGAISSYSTSAPAPSYSSYPSQAPTPVQPATTYVDSNPNKVTHYTQQYHQWTATLKGYQAQVQRLPYSNQHQREELQSKLDWAKYYADQSSRAAHHFYQTPNAPPSFELPPLAPVVSDAAPTPPPPLAPPASSATQRTRAPQSVSTPITRVSASASANSGSRNSSDRNTPGTLTRYVQRCLDGCTTDVDRKAVQLQVEKIIANAIQRGDLHTKNWDTVPLLTVVGGNRYVPPQPQQPVQQPSVNAYSPSNSHHSNRRNSGTSYSHYGHGASPKSNSNAGHYGPAFSSPNPSSPLTSSSRYNPYAPTYTNSTGSSPKDEDFISFSSCTTRPKKKFKKDPKGFVQSSQALARRQQRFAGAGGLSDATVATTARHGNEHDKYMGKSVVGGTRQLDDRDYERMTVKGTCTTLEKEYLRLTAPPRAKLVRPKPILEQHLQNLIVEYYGPGGEIDKMPSTSKRIKRREYVWFCSQLKAVRQDLTIQRIQDAFAINVYETHARIALLEGDLNEFNQCQTQLKELYELCRTDTRASPNENEFIAYRLLYHIFLTTNDTYEAGSSEIYKILGSLTSRQRQISQSVVHALKVRESVALSDYLNFFRLHSCVPHLGSFLTERIVPSMRLRGLRRITKGYRPSMPVEMAVRLLGFDNHEEGLDWMLRCGCLASDDNSVFLTKESDSLIHEPLDKIKNSLI